MQYLVKYQQAKLNCAKKRFTISKFSANWSFFTKFLAIFCYKYDQNHPFLQEMLLWNIKFNFGTCFKMVQYADDLTLFMPDLECAQRIFHLI